LVDLWFEKNARFLYVIIFKNVKTTAVLKLRCLEQGLLAAAAEVCRACGICGGQIVAGLGFLRVFRFPLPILIAPAAPHSLRRTL
jgi:hypothetical protein